MKMDIYETLKNLKSIVDVSGTIERIVNSSAMTFICSACSILAFLFLVSGILKKMVEDGGELRLGRFAHEIIAVVIIVAMFGNTAGYKLIATIIINLNEAIGGIFNAEMMQFKMEQQFFYHELIMKKVEKINIINPFSWTATIDIILLSVVLHLFNISIYALMAYPAIFFLISIVIAPVMMAFAVYDTGFMRRWLNLLLASMFFSIFARIFIIITGESHMLLLMSESIKNENVIVPMAVGLIMFLFVIYIPFIVGYLFNVRILGAVRFIFPIALFEIVYRNIIGIGRSYGKLHYKKH